MTARIQREPRTSTALLGLLVLVGVVLRVRQYVVGRSLWVDEAALALNILERAPRELMQPLSYLQGSPAGFLLLVKAATVWGGENEYWLRLVPLLAGLLTLVLFPIVARRFLSREAMLLALLILVIARPLVNYATELKQYSLDVLVTVLSLGLFVILRSRALSLIEGALFALAGALFIWLSHAAVFVLAAIGLTMLVVAWRNGDRRQIALLTLVGAVWLLAFASQAVLTLGSLTRDEALQEFWVGGFMPPLTAGLQVPLWFWQKFGALTGFTLGLSVGIGSLALVAGMVVFFRRDRAALAVLVGPMLLMLLAALLRRYPFADRLLLFTTPLVAILVAAGIESLMALLRPHSRLLAYALPVLLLFQPVAASWELLTKPQYKEELAPVLAHVRENRQPGDRLYVYYGSQLPFSYYAPRFGFDSAVYSVGVESRSNWMPYFEEMDRLAASGARVWMIFSHVYTEGGASEESLMVNYLNHLGPVHIDLFRAPGAAAYLYDFR